MRCADEVRRSIHRYLRQGIDIAEHKLVIGVKQRRIIDPPQVVRQPDLECGLQFIDRAIDALGGLGFENEAVPCFIRFTDTKINQREHRRRRHRRDQHEGERDTYRRGAEEFKHSRSA